MSWAHRERGRGQRTFFGESGLVVTAIVALLAATCVLLSPAGATSSPAVDAFPNNPPDLLNDSALGGQPTDSGANAFGQFYPQPSPGLYEGLFTTTSAAQYTALQDLQTLAIDNTLESFNLPTSDTAAVQTWGRDDALAQMFTLLNLVAETTNGGALPPGLTAADKNGILSWLAQVIYRQSELSSDFAGLEYVKWAGLDQATYKNLVAQLNYDLNTSNSNQIADENNLSAFLSATNDPPVDFADPSDPATATEGYCVYQPPPAPSGLSNYPTYDGNIYPGTDTSAPSICFGNGGIGCTISCLPDEPSYQDFQEWGTVDAEAALENNDDDATSANQVALALGLTAIVGSVAVGTSLGSTLAATGALVGSGIASLSAWAGDAAASADAVVATYYAYAGATTSSGFVEATAATTAAEAAAGGYRRSRRRCDRGGRDPLRRRDRRGVHPARRVREHAGLARIDRAGRSQRLSVDRRIHAGHQRLRTALHPAHTGNTPTPLITGACPPIPNALNPPEQCLNPPAPLPPTPGVDPVFAVTPQGGGATEDQSSITWDDVGTGAATTARLVNTDAGNPPPATSGEPDAWFVEQTKDYEGNPFQVIYGTGQAGTEFQSLSMDYTDWAGDDEVAYLLWVPSANAYEFTPQYTDLLGCVSNAGGCVLSPTIDYQYNGIDYSAQVVAPSSASSADTLTVAPTYSANLTEGTPVTFDANASESMSGVGLTYQWQYEQQYVQLSPTDWLSCGEFVGNGDTPAVCLSAPVDGDGAQITFPTGGTYPVTLTVTDSLGFSTSDTFDVTVGDVGPTVSLSPVNNSLTDFTCSILDSLRAPSCNVTVLSLGGTTAIGGTFSHTGLQDVETLSIDWGDGTVDTYPYGPSTSLPTGFPGWPSTTPVPFEEMHTYDIPGSYTATVTATDQSGATSTQTTCGRFTSRRALLSTSTSRVAFSSANLFCVPLMPSPQAGATPGTATRCRQPAKRKQANVTRTVVAHKRSRSMRPVSSRGSVKGRGFARGQGERCANGLRTRTRQAPTDPDSGTRLRCASRRRSTRRLVDLIQGAPPAVAVVTVSRPVGGILSGPLPRWEAEGRGGHPSERPTWGASLLRDRTSSPSPTLGLAPGGVYRAGGVTPAAGALLPHLFTLTCAGPEARHRRFPFCGTVLRVTPTGR
jgi:hypothetical protein